MNTYQASKVLTLESKQDLGMEMKVDLSFTISFEKSPLKPGAYICMLLVKLTMKQMLVFVRWEVL